jgi:hypothetical protein
MISQELLLKSEVFAGIRVNCDAICDVLASQTPYRIYGALFPQNAPSKESLVGFDAGNEDSKK